MFYSRNTLFVIHFVFLLSLIESLVFVHIKSEFIHAFNEFYFNRSFQQHHVCCCWFRFCSKSRASSFSFFIALSYKRKCVNSNQWKLLFHCYQIKWANLYIQSFIKSFFNIHTKRLSLFCYLFACKNYHSIFSWFFDPYSEYNWSRLIRSKLIPPKVVVSPSSSFCFSSMSSSISRGYAFHTLFYL